MPEVPTSRPQEIDDGAADIIAALEEVIDAGSPEGLTTFVRLIPPEDTAYTLSRLDDERRNRML
ncbi:MAG: hypothetical protein AAF078_04395, partial [Planctomycetota bacterium]